MRLRGRWKWIGLCVAGIVCLVLLWAIWVVFRGVPAGLRQPPPAMQARLDALISASDRHFAQLHPGQRLTPWDQRDPPASIEAFVRFQLAHGVAADGARRYLEARKIYDDEGIRASWEKAAVVSHIPNRSPDELWGGSQPLPMTLVEWLVDHPDWIAALRRMIAAGGPPFPSLQENLALEPAKLFAYPSPDIFFFQCAEKSLLAESRRLRLAGDPDSAAAVLVDAFRLASFTRYTNGIGCLIAIAMEQNAAIELRDWLATGTLPPTAIPGFQTVLDSPLSNTLADVGKATTLHYYALARGTLVYMLGRTPTFITVYEIKHFGRLGGLDFDYDRFMKRNYVSFLKENPRRILGLTLRAWALKMRPGAVLRRFDAYYISECDADEFRDSKAGDGLSALNESIYEPVSFMLASLSEGATRGRAAQARVNLLRLELMVVISGEVPPRPATAAQVPPESPWTDPFTGKPLTVKPQPGGATLLYSLGPDLKDDGGAIEYDPTNGTISGGDIVLRLPRKIE